MTHIYKRVNTADLFHDLKAMGRENFSYGGAEAIMQWLEELAEDCGIPMEYDPIAYCVEFSEYKDLENFNDYYDPSNPFDSWDEVSENTTVIAFEGGYIVQDF